MTCCEHFELPLSEIPKVVFAHEANGVDIEPQVPSPVYVITAAPVSMIIDS